MSFKKSLMVVGAFALFTGLTPANANIGSGTNGTALSSTPGDVIILDHNGTEKIQFSATGNLGEIFENQGLKLTSYRTEDDIALDGNLSLNPEIPTVLFEKSIENSFDTIVLNFQKETVEDDSLLIGVTEVEQKGVNGVAVKTVVSVNSQKSQTSEETITVLQSPVSEITRVGTQLPNLENIPKIWKPGDSGIAESTKKLRAALFAQFPELTTIGGYRNCDWTGEHCTGRALDIMIPNYRQNQDLGNEIRDWVIAQSDIGVVDTCWVIWQQTIAKPEHKWERSPMEDRGNDVTNHFDHLHVFLKTESGTCTTQPNTH